LTRDLIELVDTDRYVRLPVRFIAIDIGAWKAILLSISGPGRESPYQ
jgi:hypothetical protein